MSITLLHSADWQIGKQFGFVPGDAGAALRMQRFETVGAVAKLAVERAVDAVLVAGDVFEHHAVSDETLRRTLNQMRAFAGPWVLLPGNHDPALGAGAWTRLRAPGFAPANVHLALEPAPLVLAEGGLAVLPAPLSRRHEARDLTAWFDEAATPAGALRIGLAHGSVTNRLPERSEAYNTVADTRADTARLDYLALGDWHGTLAIAPRTWYAGTPEPDRFKENDPGNVLLVEIDAPGAAPRVERVPVGHYAWRERAFVYDGEAAAAHVEHEFAALGESARVLLRARFSGNVDFAARRALDELLAVWRARFRHLEVDDTDLLAAPSEEDLGTLAGSGFVEQAAAELRALMASGTPQAATAREALRILFAEKSRIQG